jgi:hypothetical protein
MKKLETGNIYSFHYSRFQVDPYPLVLVLYCDSDICHALNFHYLGKTYTQELINMITQIAMKSIKVDSMYAHYHDWMKKKIPGIVRHSYRTYKPSFIKYPKKLTNGYWGIDTFLKEYQKTQQHPKLTKIQNKLLEKVSKQQTKDFNKIKQEGVFNIEKMINQINQFVENSDKILQEGRKDDLSKYTFLNKKFK